MRFMHGFIIKVIFYFYRQFIPATVCLASLQYKVAEGDAEYATNVG